MALAQLIDVDISVWPADQSFRYIRDFLACRNGIADFTKDGAHPGPGYQIVDESYRQNQDPLVEGDWVVLQSNGEANTYPHYVKLEFGNSNHGVSVFLHWDKVTHSGSQYYNTSIAFLRNVSHNNYQGIMSIHADLDEVHLIMQPNLTTRTWQSFGRLKPQNMLYDGSAVQIQDASEYVQDAEQQNIVLPSWPSWASVGRNVYHWDTKNVRKVTILATSQSTRTITVNASYNIDAGSWMAGDICLFTSDRDFSTGMTSTGMRITPGRSSVLNVQYNLGYIASSVLGRYTDGFYGVLPFDPDKPNNRNYGATRNVSAIWLYVDADAYREYGVRGFFGLAGETSAQLADSTAWIDDNGTAWRTYPVHGQAYIALREDT